MPPTFRYAYWPIRSGANPSTQGINIHALLPTLWVPAPISASTMVRAGHLGEGVAGRTSKKVAAAARSIMVVNSCTAPSNSCFGVEGAVRD